MELAGWIFAAIVGVYWGFLLGKLLVRQWRWTRGAPRLQRGDRPELAVRVDGILYDVTDTGVRSEQGGMTIWTYTGPQAARRSTDRPELLIKELPPSTEIRLVFPAIPD